MTEAEALTLLAALRAAFPRQPFDRETAAVYAAALLDLDADLGRRAIETLISSSLFFPSIAEIREDYRLLRRYQPQQIALEEGLPSEEERAAFVAEMRRWTTERFGVSEPVSTVEGLDSVGAGRCDECAEKVRQRWQLGRFALCHGCVTRRRRAVPSGVAANV